MASSALDACGTPLWQGAARQLLRRVTKACRSLACAILTEHVTGGACVVALAAVVFGAEDVLAGTFATEVPGGAGVVTAATMLQVGVVVDALSSADGEAGGA